MAEGADPMLAEEKRREMECDGRVSRVEAADERSR